MSASTPSPRKSRASRISVSLRDGTVERLQQLAQQEGRSLSNLCAHLLEQAIARYGSWET